MLLGFGEGGRGTGGGGGGGGVEAQRNEVIIEQRSLGWMFTSMAGTQTTKQWRLS